MIKKNITLPVLSLCLMAMSVMMISACGIKPNRVDPPAGKEDKLFPSQYPKNVSK